MRQVRRVFAVLAITALITIVVWFGWLPHYRPGLRAGETYGIDVSHHQGSIDWSRVAKDNVSFAYIKATEGGDFTDSRFNENWTGAAEAGLARGAYHFFTLCTPGTIQAGHFLEIVPEDPQALPPAVDLELDGNCSARPDPATVRQEILAFLAAVEGQMGRKVVLYVSDDFEESYAVRTSLDRPLWDLEFLRRPSVEGWLIWQVMSLAHVDGVDGDVGLDLMR